MSVKTYLTNNEKEIKEIAKKLINQNSLIHLEHLIDTHYSRITVKLAKEFDPLANTIPLNQILNPNKATKSIKDKLKAIDETVKPLYFKAEDSNKGSRCRPYKIPINLAPKTSWLTEIVASGKPLTDVTQNDFDRASAEAKSRLKKSAKTYERTMQAENHYKNITGKINANNTFDEYVHAAEAEFGKNGINHHTGRKKHFKKTGQVFPRKFLSPLEFSPSILNEELEKEVFQYKKRVDLSDEMKLKYRLPALERTLERVKPIAENDVIENAVYAAIHEQIKNNVKIVEDPKLQTNQEVKPADTTIEDKVKNTPTNYSPSKPTNNETEPKNEPYTDPNPTRIIELPKIENQTKNDSPTTNYSPSKPTNNETEPTESGDAADIIDIIRKMLDSTKDKIKPEQKDAVNAMYEGLDNAYNKLNKKPEEAKIEKPESKLEETVKTTPEVVEQNKVGEVKNVRQGGGIKRTLEAFWNISTGPNKEPDFRTDYRDPSIIHGWLENLWIDAHNYMVGQYLK